MLLRNTCDSIIKQLHSKGIGAETKATPVFTAESEAKLWDAKVHTQYGYPKSAI